MRQERINSSGRRGADPHKYIFHPCAEVDAVGLACRRHALHDRQMMSAGFTAGEQPVFASERDCLGSSGSDLAFVFSYDNSLAIGLFLLFSSIPKQLSVILCAVENSS